MGRVDPGEPFVKEDAVIEEWRRRMQLSALGYCAV